MTRWNFAGGRIVVSSQTAMLAEAFSSRVTHTSFLVDAGKLESGL